MSKQFTRTIEDFICQNCGVLVKGTGYTNHCPACLYSKHVDNFPGDRTNSCHGLMKPIGLDKKRGELKILHQCLKCGVKKPCVVSSEDNLSVIQGVSPRRRPSSYQGDGLAGSNFHKKYCRSARRPLKRFVV